MPVHHDVARLADGLGFRIDLGSARPLTELTALVNAVCERTEDRAEQTVVVLELGAAPADRSWPGEVSIHEVSRWERAVRRFERLAAVSIAVAAGTCGGPALDLLLATDYRIATPDARLLLPVTDGQFWPGMAVYRLVQHLGVARARRLVLWGHDLPARHAQEIGLIDEIGDDLDEAVRTAAVWLGRASAGEVAVRRQLLLEASSVSYEEALGVHLAACDRELRRTARRQPPADGPAGERDR
ncbi:enoyl-CoA-hydratase DpgB [Streptomyces sp. LZ34]